jgi:hypothetical protein
MFTYEFLDRVADSFIPFLALIWLALSVFPGFSRQWRLVIVRFALGLACLIIAYGFMYFDAATGLWGKCQLDYSTHTAVACALTAAITTISFQLGMVAAALVLLYLPLMIYQGYHTFADILSTIAVISVPTLFMAYVIRKRSWANAHSSDNAEFHDFE